VIGNLILFQNILDTKVSGGSKRRKSHDSDDDMPRKREKGGAGLHRDFQSQMYINLPNLVTPNNQMDGMRFY
jgi:hypothetical protein